MIVGNLRHGTGLEIRGILVANATMFCHLLPGFSCGSKHLLLPYIHGIVNLMHFCVMFVMRSSTQPKRPQHKNVYTILLPQNQFCYLVLNLVAKICHHRKK